MTRILITGFAGQGALWLGEKIAEEILKRDPQKFVSFLVEYQAGVRTGESRAQVVVSNKSVVCPFVDRPDILIELKKSQIKCGSELIKLKNEGRINESALKEVFENAKCRKLFN